MSFFPKVAIVGATGAVGVEMLRCLEQRNVPVNDLKLLASARSKGKKMQFKGQELEVEELTHSSFEGVEIALFSAGGDLSREYAPSAVQAGATVIDNSSAFRMDEGVPLIVPEINPEAMATMKKGIIANPNCTTIITLMGLFPLHLKFGLKGIIASTYQAVSGSGQQGMDELEAQGRAYVEGSSGEVLKRSVYPHQILHNVIPHVDAFQEGGYTKEELKMLNESRKILGIPDLKVTCTCVRVPVMRSHSVSLTALFEKEVSVNAAQEEYQQGSFSGVSLRDDYQNALYPTPLDTTGKDECLVGRIRADLVLDNALSLWIVGDQVRKGAALNAVQIAELLVRSR